MERPTSVLVLGVLNLLFAVLGLLGTAGSVLVLLGMNEQNPVHIIMQNSPAYRIFMYVSVPLGVVFTIVLALAGIGLMTSKAWGRKATIVYAIYALVMGVVGGLINSVLLIGPLIANANSGGGPAELGAAIGALGGMLGTCLGLIYPIVLLIFMYRKNVVDYFRQVPGSPHAPSGFPS